MQAKLIIRDEVNVKIEGLELSTRKKLVDKFKFEIPGARYQPSVRLGRWDGKVAFFQLGGSTYINLLPEIIPFLDSEGYDVDIEDQRTYSNKFEFPTATEDMFADFTWPAGHPRAGEPIMLRDYQVPILNNFFANPQSLQEIATGAGKTIMTAALSRSVAPCPAQIVGEFTVTNGNGLTVTVDTAVAVQPNVEPVTVYVVVVTGDAVAVVTPVEVAPADHVNEVAFDAVIVAV